MVDMTYEQQLNLKTLKTLDLEVFNLKVQFKDLLQQQGCHPVAIKSFFEGMITTSEVIRHTPSPTMETYEVGLELTEKQNSLNTYKKLCK